MVSPPAGYSLICQTWPTENARDLEASNFWNTHSQRLRIVAIQMIWQNCMGSGWQSLIGWIFSVAIVSSAVLAAVSGNKLPECFIINLIWCETVALCGVNENGPRHLRFGCIENHEAFIVGSQIHGFSSCCFVVFWHLTGSILPPPTERDLIGGCCCTLRDVKGNVQQINAGLFLLEGFVFSLDD